MDKIGKKRGLIRYDSLTGIEEGKRQLLTPRTIAYSCVLLLLIVIQIVLFTNRTDVEVVLLRTPGMLYQQVDDQYISNLYNYQIINKTTSVIEDIEFRLITDGGRIKIVGEISEAPKQGMSEGALFIEMEEELLKSRKTSLKLEVYSGETKIDVVKTKFLGPVK